MQKECVNTKKCVLSHANDMRMWSGSGCDSLVDDFLFIYFVWTKLLIHSPGLKQFVFIQNNFLSKIVMQLEDFVVVAKIIISTRLICVKKNPFPSKYSFYFCVFFVNNIKQKKETRTKITAAIAISSLR